MLDKDNTIFIPLGTRCNSASIIKDKLGLRKCSYPFDWIDVNLKTILKYISIQRSEIESFCMGYFATLTLISKEDNAWYPHEFVKNEPVVNIETSEVLKSIAQKYIRRYNRLHDAFDSGKDLLFLTCMPHFKQDSEGTYEQIKEKIISTTKGNIIFFTFNIADKEFIRKKAKSTHYNYTCPLNTWEQFDDSIAHRLNLLITT